MLIVHVSYTALTGAPCHISQELTKQKNITSRSIAYHARPVFTRTFRGKKLIAILDANIQANKHKFNFALDFDFDLDWQNEKDQIEACALLEQADIIHFHHYLNIDSEQNKFKFNFLHRKKPSAKILVQHHCAPILEAPEVNIPAHVINNHPYPKLVISQAMERFYPDARMAPNILPIYRDNLSVHSHKNNPFTIPQIGYSPSNIQPFWKDRWSAKGSPQIWNMLDNLATDNLCVPQIFANRTHTECLLGKQECHLGIDDIFTGGFHRSGLEFLSQGSACINYLDERTDEVLKFITGCEKTPFISSRGVGEQTTTLLRNLCQEPEQIRELGKQARNWIEKYYQPNELIKHYLQAYELLLDNQELTSSKWLIGQEDIAKKRNHRSYFQMIDKSWPGNKPIYKLARQAVAIKRKIKNLL